MADKETVGLEIEISAGNVGVLGHVAMQTEKVRSATDKASRAGDNWRKSLKFLTSEIGSSWKAKNKLENASKKVGESWKFLGLSAISLNQSLELIKKAFNLVERAMTTLISKSLEYREANDPIRKEVENFGNTIGATVARLGDMFMPTITAMARAFTPLLEDFQKWAGEKENIEALGQAIFDIAVVVNNGLSTALVTATVLWGKFNKAANFANWMIAKKDLEGMTEMVEDEIDKRRDANGRVRKEVADHFRKLVEDKKRIVEFYEKAGYDDDAAMEARLKAIDNFQAKVSDAIAKGRENLKDTGKSFTQGGKISAAEKERIAAEAEAQKKADEELAAYSLQVAEEVEREALEDYKKGLIEGTRLLSNELKKRGALTEQQYRHATNQNAALRTQSLKMIEEVNLAMSETSSPFMTQLEAQRRLNAESAGLTQKEFENQQRSIRRSRNQVRDELARSLITIKDAFARGGIAVALEALGSMIVAKIEEAFATKIADAILSGATSLLSNIPVLGGIFSFLGFNKGGLVPQMFADGGPVRGGAPGRDSVPAMLTPGEYVLPVDVVNSIRQGAPPKAPGRFASGGYVQGSGGSAGPSMPPIQQNFLAFTSSRAQVRKLQRDVFEPERSRLKRNRVIREG